MVREALSAPYRKVVDIGAGCGPRQGEILGLAVDEVDFLAGVVHVVRQVKLVEAQLVFAPPKGGKLRDVPLPDSVAFAVAEHITQRPPLTVTLPWKAPHGPPVTAPLLFYSRERKPVNRNYFNMRVWKWRWLPPVSSRRASRGSGSRSRASTGCTRYGTSTLPYCWTRGRTSRLCRSTLATAIRASPCGPTPTSCRTARRERGRPSTAFSARAETPTTAHRRPRRKERHPDLRLNQMSRKISICAPTELSRSASSS